MHTMVSPVLPEAPEPAIQVPQLFCFMGFNAHGSISYPHSPICIQEVLRKEQSQEPAAVAVEAICA